MLDPVTLDQLRTFALVNEEGNFSAAARKLRRVQSAVSTSMSNLEKQLGIAIWDRSRKVAALTDAGEAVLRATQRVLAEMDALRRLTTNLAGGTEAKVSLCLDALFPLDALVELCVRFAAKFPDVDLRVDTRTMSAVTERVLDGRATLGVVSPLGLRPGLERHDLSSIRMVPVVAPKHPLARVKGAVSTAELADHVQLVLSEGSDPDQAVLSPRTWRIKDLQTKHAMLRAGIGWGNLPEHLARKDLAARRLVLLAPAAWSKDEHVLSLSAVHRRDVTMGPAHRWILSAMKTLCAEAIS